MFDVLMVLLQILLSVLCILIEIRSRAHAKGTKKERLIWFQIWQFCSRFSNEGAASRAVKGLSQKLEHRSGHNTVNSKKKNQETH